MWAALGRIWLGGAVGVAGLYVLSLVLSVFTTCPRPQWWRLLYAVFWPFYLAYTLADVAVMVVQEIRFRLAVNRMDREITELLIQARSRLRDDQAGGPPEPEE